MSIIVKSPAFEEGTEIPVVYTCDGEDISPEIVWSNIPSNTKSLVLIMEDPDAPVGIFTHWVVYDIPPYVTGLPENFPKVPDVEGIKQGINDFGKIGYGGPCPPPGKPHRYFFIVLALDIPSLGLPPGEHHSVIRNTLEGHIISEGYIMGVYGR